ncbi:MAG: hypothetical protein IPK82_32925 [Polyangiaceae bacterium]|nr:hypothetical protein [Polyangiaceae bacterium]
MLIKTKWCWALLPAGVLVGSSGCLFDWTVPTGSGGSGGGGVTTQPALDVSCPAFGPCECPAGQTCAMTCETGSCTISCKEDSNCSVTCVNANCTISCDASASCDVQCNDAVCTMTCDPDASCSCTPDLNCS